MVHAQDATRASLRQRISPSVPPRVDDTRYAGLPHYIFGLHDSGGEAQMLAAYKPGWIVVSVQVNPPDSNGDFAALAEQGLGVIVRLNNGYNGDGTLPHSTEYETFAQQCAEFVANSQGARIWVIGNEPNAAQSRPGHEGSAHDNSGEVITPEMYARCFNQCRRAIHDVPGHATDWVIPAAVAPFNTQTTYPANPTGDWVRYFADVLFQVALQGGKPDALALHTYTHGTNSNLVTSDARGTSKFANRHWHFRAYRDFISAITPTMRHLPVLITAAAPLEPGWSMHDRDWIQVACTEISTWNANPANQAIQALCLFRWHALPGEPAGWGMANKPQVVEDLCAALQNDYRVRWPMVPPTPDFAVKWLSPFNVSEHTLPACGHTTGHVALKNTGARAWLASGNRAVHLGMRWFTQEGDELLTELLTASPLVDLPHTVLPGQTVTLDQFDIVAPRLGGEFVCKLDLKQDGGGWFSTQGAPGLEQHFTITAPDYLGEWLDGPEPSDTTLLCGSSSIESVLIRNLGMRTWAADGAEVVHLTYRWYDAQERPVLLANPPQESACSADVEPGEIILFAGISLSTPPDQGDYTLRWILAIGDSATRKELVIHSQSIRGILPIADWAAEWKNEMDLPETALPNTTVHGSVRVKNVGAQTWYAEGEPRVVLDYHWQEEHGEPVQGGLYHGTMPLSRDVAPNESALFSNLAVRIPVPRGDYRLVFDLVKPGAIRFSDAGSQPLVLSMRVATDAADYAAEWTQMFDIPKGIMLTGQTLSGRVVVKNVGAQIWDAAGDHAVQLGYRWLDAKGNRVSTLSTPAPEALANPVLPGELAALSIALHPPEVTGKYVLQWELQSVESLVVAIKSVPVLVKNPPLDWGAEFLSHDVPASLTVGQTTAVAVRVENIGRNVWPSKGEHPVLLIGHWLRSDGERVIDSRDISIALESGVAIEGTVELTTEITAPPVPGAYTLHWDLYRQGLSAFATGGNLPLSIPVSVTESPAPQDLWRAEASHNALAARSAIDGNLSTFWSSGASQTPGMWFQIDLGMARLIDAVAFRSGGQGYPFGYEVRVSIDGETWRMVARVAEGNDRDTVVLFAPCNVQYVRVELIAASTREWRVSEVQIHSNPGWNATASINNHEAARAIDNDLATAWTTGNQLQKPNLWFQLDLGQPECINGLSLISRDNEIPASYRVTVWNESAGGWQKIAECEDNRAPVDLAFAPVVTQYVNIQLLKSADHPFSICEFRVLAALTDWISPS